MKVLIADDDATMVEMCSKTLARSKFTVDVAMDFESTFQKARTKKYDVIILDLMFADERKKTGFDIIAGLRAMDIETPILTISARSMVQDRIKSLDLGADDYLVKTFSLNELVARTKALMRRRTSRRSNILRCSGLTIDFSKLEVMRENTSIKLSKKEFGILTELVKNKNTVVTRDDLFEKVWGERDIDVLSNTMDVHIRSLRSKIDKPFPGKNLIQTIRGYGYLFRDTTAENKIKEPRKKTKAKK